MITKEEIEAKSAELEIHAANVERDYVFGWFLAGLYTVSPFKDTLILKAGNAFRKAYFPATRFSADLDFSTQSAGDQAGLRTELNKICDFVHQASGIVFDTERTLTELKFAIDNEKTVYHARLYFKDFYGNPEKITISIRLDRIRPTVFTSAGPQSRSSKFRRQTMYCPDSLREARRAAGEKLKCLLQRRHLADLFDYVYSIFINRELAVDKGEIVNTFLRKTIFSRDRRAITGLFVGLPLQAFKEVWSKYIVCPSVSMISWDSAVETFVASIKELFGEAVQSFGRPIYFPAHLRNPILDAGSSLTLERAPLRAVKEMKGGGHTGAMTGAIVGTAIVFFPAAPLFLFMHGKDITIPKGTEITAYINGDIPLDPKKFVAQASVASEPISATTQPTADPSAMQTATATVAALSTVDIKSTPAGAEITVDDKFMGNTPSSLRLAAGDHKVKLEKSGFKIWKGP